MWVYGGPVVAVWGFVLVAACSFLVALSLAELASCYPHAAQGTGPQSGKSRGACACLMYNACLQVS